MPLRSNPGTAYRSDIDGLRALAVAGVVVFHADPRLAPGGFAGVDVFFVISGYLISGLVLAGLAAGTFSFREFFTRRLVRLAPALALVLLAVWAVGWFTLLPAEYEQLGAHVAAGAGFVANLRFWYESGNYFDGGAASKPLLHLWSLGVEEQFYLLWPACLALAWWRRLRLFPVMAGVAAVSFAINVASIGPFPAAAFYLPVGRLWELAAGGMLALLTPVAGLDPRLTTPSWLAPLARVPSWGAQAASVAGLLLVAISFASLGDRAFPGWWAVMPVAGSVLLIASGRRAWIGRMVLSHPVLTFVGLISYPLYLWHWPVLTFTRIIRSHEPGVSVTIAGVVASVLLAWLTWRFVEQPVRAGHRPGRRVAIPVRLASVLLAAGAAGLAVFVWSRDLPARFPSNVQYLVDFGYDYATAYREGRCYLAPDQHSRGFSDECVDPSIGSPTPLVVLWGDSHAAHLYPGLREAQRGRGFRVAQFTTAACPPLLTGRVGISPSCREINETVVRRIAQLRPQVVLLAARWDVYDQSGLAQTVTALRHASGDRIVILGQLPNWTDRLPRLLFNAVRRNPLGGVPSRLPFFEPGGIERADRDLRERATSLGAVFVSGYGILCDTTGCLAKMGDGAGGITTWDDHHLTSEGSAFVAERLVPRLFEPTRRGG